ncbi:MFS transporter [Desulfurococcaceae archaeon MEX13E-LK6-19]|nr:MFS transporter [Desulfurococcaceae archaeon MEX13E-LK6-19]
MRWSEIPLPARRYILYHTIITPLLITWYMVPLYMMMTGYNVFEVGLFFTIVNIASIPVTYMIGKLFDKVPIRHGLITIDALDGIALICYGFAYGPIAPLMLFLGLLINKISGLFYPLYQAAEKILYPKDRLEEVFAWHMRLPELSQLIGFLVLGYLFGYVFNKPVHYRVAFILFGLSSVFTIMYLIKALPRMDTTERISTEKLVFKIDREFKIILVIEALMIIAWALAPEIVLLNYIVNKLGLTLFEVMVVEAAISIGAIAATFVSERISSTNRFKAMAFGYLLVTLWALIMYLAPLLPMVVIAYLIGRFGETLAFPFYRSWLFSKIPSEKAASILSAISSYRRIIILFTPAIAGYLAYISPTLPYLASLVFFMSIIFILLYMEYIVKRKRESK